MEKIKQFTGSCLSSPKHLFGSCLILTILVMIFTCNFIYSADDQHALRCDASLKILSLNTFGTPQYLGSKHTTERFAAIAEEVGKADYDLYLFQEVWMRKDHDQIMAKLPPGYSMTPYSALAADKCGGKYTPSGCSGLAIVSKFPIERTMFQKYEVCGNKAFRFLDGECISTKGYGRIRIRPANLSLAIDVVVTHTIAEPPKKSSHGNTHYRIKQVNQLLEQVLKKSDADVLLLGADLNAAPDDAQGKTVRPAHIVSKHMYKTCKRNLSN